MSHAKGVYSLLFRRTSTFAITIMFAAVFFERIFDQGGDKLWKHIKYQNEEE
uniref:Complex III subunit 9 n=1 Tax=Oncorhynchus mykiss TaxID=8022 RepID=A0A8C7SQR2_ONCMY